MQTFRTANAFSRTELLASVAALFLLALVMAPAALTNKADSNRLACSNNLRLIGRAVQIWASDHTQQFPWRTLQADGGMMPPTGSRPASLWRDYAHLSNELVTPKILACPADQRVNRATSFSDLTSNPVYRLNAISYPLNMDGSMDLPRTWLSGDGNFYGSECCGGCSVRINNLPMITPEPWNQSIFWTNAVHGFSGHVLTTDGVVEFTTSERFREILFTPGVDDNGNIHVLRSN